MTGQRMQANGRPHGACCHVNGIGKHRRRRAVVYWLLIASVIGACASPMASSAQRASRDSSDAYLETQWNVGAYAPLGQQRHAVARAPYYEVAVLAVPIRKLAFVASAGWAPTRDRQDISHAPVDITDLHGGVELRPFAIARGDIVLRPFAGLGLGARSYYYSRDSINITSFAGYASLGVAYQYAATGVRIAASDHVSGYKPIAGRSQGSTRHEVIVTIGVIARAVP